MTSFSFFLLISSPFIGSFIGASAKAWPGGEAIANARSTCAHCQHTLHVFDLIPILSFILLCGKCRTCVAPIGWDVLWVEVLATGIAVVSVFVFTGHELQLASVLLGWILLFAAMVDVRLQLLPDSTNFGLIALGALVSFWKSGFDGLWVSLAGAMIGFGFFFIISALYRRVRKRDGLGLGDAKLLAVGGAWCGAFALNWIVLLAASFALLNILFAKVWRKQNIKADTALAFGPYLAAAIFIIWLYNGENGFILSLL